MISFAQGYSKEVPFIQSKQILAQKTKAYDYVNTAIIPFELDGGLIFLDANLKGQKDSYIFDTGAPSLVLNSNFSSHKSTKNSNALKGICGRINVQKLKIKNFIFGLFKKKKVNALETNISHLENLKKRKIKGLVGQSIINDYETLIDYKDRKITIFKPNRQKVYHKTEQPHTVVPFEMNKHIPVVTVLINGKTFKFGIDTGAELNVINERIFHLIDSESISDWTTKKIRGIGKNAKRVGAGKMKEIEVQGESFKDMDFVVSNLSVFNKKKKVKLDGLLGYPFLSSGKFSINYKKESLYVWENYNSSTTDAIAFKSK